MDVDNEKEVSEVSHEQSDSLSKNNPQVVAVAGQQQSQPNPVESSVEEVLSVTTTSSVSTEVAEQQTSTTITTQAAQAIGSKLSSSLSAAGKTTSVTATKISGFFKTRFNDLAQNPPDISGRLKQLGHDVKQAVEHTKIITEFNREQADFARQQAQKSHTRVQHPLLHPDNPEHWIYLMFSRQQQTAASNGTTTTTATIPPHHFSYLSSLIDNLTNDEKNFLGRGPPEGSKFQFADLFPIISEQSCDWLHVAQKCLRQNSDLNAVRYQLVPKRIHEEQFWRNYFYKVWLIKENYLRQREHDAEVLEQTCLQANERTESENQTKLAAAAAKVDNNSDGSMQMMPLSDKHSSDSIDAVSRVSPTTRMSSTSPTKLTTPPVDDDEEGDWEAEIEKELSGYDVVTSGGNKVTSEAAEHTSVDSTSKQENAV